MKLRLRCRETRETIKIDVCEPCTVQQLNEILSFRYPNAISGFEFSLNGADALRISSPQETLQSLGIIAGDLVFFSFRTPDESSPARLSKSVSDNMQDFDKTENISANPARDDLGSSSTTDAMINLLDESDALGAGDPGAFNGMEADFRRFSEPYFLRKVLRNDVIRNCCGKKLLVAAVHAVFMESSFVRVDPSLGVMVEGTSIDENWPDKVSTISFFYTLPALIENGSVKNSAKVKVQSLGSFLNVYASLVNSKSRTYRSCLDSNRFASALSSLESHHDISKREAFELWKRIKDDLTYPLLLELCYVSNFPLPPCLMLIPMDVKLKIIELLPAVDVAKLGCVCKELEYLSSNDDVWKRKYVEEFGVAVDVHGSTSWKRRFSRSWELLKQRTLAARRPAPFSRPHLLYPSFPIIRRDPSRLFPRR